MKLNGKSLDKWFIEEIHDLARFPFEHDYKKDYSYIASQLNDWVHSNVNTGAMIKDGGYLTDHGPGHIKTVIKRVSQMLDNNDNCILNPFEVYVLLVAIHLHDVGNIIGREGHHINAQMIIDKLGNGVASQDKIIWENIYEIAKAHKGNIIQKLNELDYIHEIEIRPQLIAALLKFGDELAENSSRADRINTVIDNLPEESKLYHEYALALHSVVPDPVTHQVSMLFQIDENKLKVEFLKKIKKKKRLVSQKIFLIDEIYERTLKTHHERLYCMRFMRRYNISFDVIKVAITITLNNSKKINQNYILIEGGIGEVNMDEIFRMCPELKERTGLVYSSKSTTGNLNELANS